MDKEKILESRRRIVSGCHLIRPGTTMHVLHLFLGAQSLHGTEELAADLCAHELILREPGGSFDIHPKLIRAIVHALAR